MIPELGLFCLCLSTVLSLVLPSFLFVGARKGSPQLEALWRPASVLIPALLTASLLCLGYAFLTDDFSVAYVANHSNTQLEIFYKISAVWSSHEGSLLLWVWIISLWMLGAAAFVRKEESFKANMTAAMLCIIGLLSLFLVFSSNPFERLLPLVPPEGKDLNPILQDVGMIFHPPTLFAGYAGLALCFAASAAVLLSKSFDRSKADTLLAVSVITWVFLTAGNVLGSWWAYTELGWGGWWFWDPVENSSFIPWLLVTAQIHALLLVRIKGLLARSALLLCIVSFAASLLGSFIVRSGVIQSVHAFAADPGRGVFLLIVSCLLLLPAVLLFAARSKDVSPEDGQALSSLDIFLILAVLLIAIASGCVLLGTLYPLFYELMGWGAISVGAPYFNAIFVPFVFIAALLIGWVQIRKAPLAVQVLLALASAAAALACALLLKNKDAVSVAAGVFSASWILLSVAANLFVRRGRLSFFALAAHAGIAVSIIGAVGDTQFQQEALVRMGPGQGRPLGDVIFVYDETKRVNTKSFYADEGQVYILDKNENEIGLLRPQRQTFKNNGMEMTAAGIGHGLLRDYYVSMGNKLSGDEYLVRLSIKPLVSWIWLGGILMMCSVLLAGVRRRKEG
jgi:cytochrome c-type biogenesis protein CcmF